MYELASYVYDNSAFQKHLFFSDKVFLLFKFRFCLLVLKAPANVRSKYQTSLGQHQAKKLETKNTVLDFRWGTTHILLHRTTLAYARGPCPAVKAIVAHARTLVFSFCCYDICARAAGVDFAQYMCITCHRPSKVGFRSKFTHVVIRINTDDVLEKCDTFCCDGLRTSFFFFRSSPGGTHKINLFGNNLRRS